MLHFYVRKESDDYKRRRLPQEVAELEAVRAQRFVQWAKYAVCGAELRVERGWPDKKHANPLAVTCPSCIDWLLDRLIARRDTLGKRHAKAKSRDKPLRVL